MEARPIGREGQGQGQGQGRHARPHGREGEGQGLGQGQEESAECRVDYGVQSTEYRAQRVAGRVGLAYNPPPAYCP